VADGPRAKPRARTVVGAHVERHAEKGDVGLHTADGRGGRAVERRGSGADGLAAACARHVPPLLRRLQFRRTYPNERLTPDRWRDRTAPCALRNGGDPSTPAVALDSCQERCARMATPNPDS